MKKLVIAGAVVLVVLQMVRPTIPSQAATAELRAPSAIRRVLDRDCYSCHSDQRRLSWFDEIVPAYWLVRHDILTAREHLNFSTLGSKPPAVQRSTLYEAVNMIRLGAMPPPSFIALHPAAKTTPTELAALMAYLAPWSPAPGDGEAPVGGAPAIAPDGAIRPVSLAAVLPELDGFPFDPSFKGWKLISTTDRGDNSTFRLILGNDIAVQAAESGNISPWPDGARFAKIAWQQESGPDGLLHPGKFVQVELMLKDADRYRKTGGWGWGRWRGSELKPYGQDARFASECMSCHRPVRKNDLVYTLPITTATAGGDSVVNNRAAALPVNLPYQPLRWGVITMYVDPRDRTTATLYGNDAAVQATRASNTTSGAPVYPRGAVLALVTWTQRDDPHWFGARIPDAPQSVEFVQAAAGQGTNYRRFADGGLKEVRATAAAAELRTSFILGLAPARLP